MKHTVQKSLACFFLFLYCSITVIELQAQAPALLKNINNTIIGGNPRGMTTVNNTVFFSANEDAHGRELWKTEGTEASTVLVMDINRAGDANPANFCNLNGTVFFTAFTVENGTELWKSDGTAAGTVLVADLIEGIFSSSPTKLTVCNGRLFFSAFRRTATPGGTIMELKLYVSDGTAAGTRVLDPNNTTIVGPENLTAVGNTLFFSASANIIGNELWRTDGTLAGTQLVHNFSTAANANGNPRNLINVGGNLFLSADDGANGRQVWRVIPAPFNLSRRTNLKIFDIPGINVSEIANLNGTVFFTAPFGVAQLSPQLFRLNSAVPEGASLVNNVLSVRDLTTVGSLLFFTQSPQLGGPILSSITANSLNATNIRTFDLISGGEYPVPKNLANVNGILFFTAATAVEGRELWRSAGALANTFMVQDFVVGSTSAVISDLSVRAGDLFFASNGLGGNELRRSNGTVNAIATVRDIGKGSSFPREFVKMGNLTYFTADDGIAGRELWKTDGTVAGTQRVADIFVGATGSNPSNLMVVTAEPGVHTLFFIAQEDNQGRQLFKLENTTNAIPWRLTYISNSLTYGSVSNLTNVNGRLHFTAPGTGLPNLPMLIYRVSISRLSAQPISGTNFAGNLVGMGSTLFYTVGLESEPGSVPALCKIVNNALFTIRIFPLIPNGEYPIPQQLKVIGTRLFFTAAEAGRGRELWVTNAAATTASRISDITPGAGSAGIGNMVNFNGVLHFTAASGLSTGDRIFKTNAGLTDVVTTGGNMQNANNLAAAGTQLFFTMSPQIGGPQLCRLLGAGTVLLHTFPLIPGGEYPIPQKLTPVGNGIFFTAASANEGRELWKSNGSTTQLVSDIRAGLGNANILEIRLSGQDLFLSANDLTAGQEPWRLANATALQGDGTDDRTEISETIVTPASVALEIRVYPNPSTNYVNVDLPQNDLTGTLSLLSASGQTVRSMQSSEGQTSIQMDVQDLPKGMYLVRWVQSDEQVVLKKLMVQ